MAHAANEAEDPIKWSLDPSTEEYAVTIAASIAAHLISQGRSVGFMAWGQHRVLLPADRGGRQLIKILERVFNQSFSNRSRARKRSNRVVIVEDD